MITIVIAIFVAPLICLLSWQVGLALGVLMIVISMFPIEGFKKALKFSECYLMKLDRPLRGDNCYYVEVLGNKVYYAFDNSHAYSLDGGAYEEKVVCGRIKIYESEKCKTPVLKVFKTSPKRDLFAIAPFSTRKEYIFYVPKGTVLRKNNKKQVVPCDVV